MVKNHRALLAALIAVIFVYQTAPVLASPDGEHAPAAGLQRDGQTAGEGSGGETVTYMIDENGERVELGADFDYDAATAGDERNQDSGDFFSYGESEIAALAEDDKLGELILTSDFQGYPEGASEFDGWVTSIASKSGLEKKSTLQTVLDSSKGMVLEFTKKKNGASNGTAAAGDEIIEARLPFASPVSGRFSVVTEMNMLQAGRLGMYLYTGLNETSGRPVKNGSFYSWDDGSNNKDPESNKPLRVQYADGGETVNNAQELWSVNHWYTLRFDVDTDQGTYDILVNGKSIAKELALPQGSGPVDGLCFEVQSDVKSLGSFRMNGVKVYDITHVEEYQTQVAAVAAALKIENADAVTESFTVPVSGDYGTSIHWTSSEPDLIQLDSGGSARVTRPVFTGAGSYPVVLTAVVQKGNVKSAPKEITVQVLELPPSNEQEAVLADQLALNFPDGFDSIGVTADFTLPVSGANGSVFTWSSSDPAIVSVDNQTGKMAVKRPGFTGAGNVQVDLTADIKNGRASGTKTLTVMVRELEPQTDLEKAMYDANQLIIGGVDLENVKAESFYLSDTGEYGTVEWSVSGSGREYIEIKKNFITDDDNITSEEGGYRALVTRPARGTGAVTVALTAVCRVGSASYQKEFQIKVQPEDDLKAYPGVEGYGAYTAGGRGGRVYHVTNLNAHGEGSLAYGLEEMKGARTIVFDVGGVIDLTSKGEPIAIKGEKYSNVTVAGQTAPYPGITLKGYGMTISSAHDVIIRNIRIRIGDVVADNEYIQSDPLSIGNSKRVIIDHCSFHWAIDMSFRATGEDITISNVVFGKNLAENSSHEKGGHNYIGMINNGAKKVSFIKNLVGDSSQRSPRITDADFIDAYSNLLYNCDNGFDMFNYEWQDKNSKMNVHDNFAKLGSNLRNKKPYRAGRGRIYAGGIMAYFKNNYGLEGAESLQERTKIEEQRQEDTSPKVTSIKHILDFGKTNSKEGAAYDLSNVTLDEWNQNPLSYDNEGKQATAGTLTYMTYPFPAPRGSVITGPDPIEDYITDAANGAGAIRPGRDLYDTMIMAEVSGGKQSSVTLDQETVAPFFEALEARTGKSYEEYKVARTWPVRVGDGPVLYSYNPATDKFDLPATTSVTSESGRGKTEPLHWDDYTDVKSKSIKYTRTDPVTGESKVYDRPVQYRYNFDVGNWWGEYCGSPGMETVYSLRDKETGRVVTTTDPEYDKNKFEYQSSVDQYVSVYRTVADLYPADYVKEDFPEAAAAMERYREKHYAGKPTHTAIAWDSMGDGIPDWYKEYRGWSIRQALSQETDPESGYTYLEEYLAFAAGDKELDTDSQPVTMGDFKVNNLGYSTAQIFWNTDYRATCVVEYGTKPGEYTQSETLQYGEETDGYHTYHAVTLSQLEPDTQYYYRVTATDELSKVTVAEYDANDPVKKKMTFHTTSAPAGAEDILPEKPVITKTVPYLNQVRLNWSGSVVTDSGYEIYYDTKSGGGVPKNYANKITGLSARTYKQVIQGLENGTPYYFIVAAVNENGRTASDEAVVTPSGVLLQYDFTSMTKEEQEAFTKNEYIYFLGGRISFQEDPDTGETVLQLLDETNSHGVNTDLKFMNTQEDSKFTYEVKFKVLYQKQSDALNRQDGEASGTYISDYPDDHNTFQINFYKDALLSEEKDSTNADLWESAFSIQFDARSKALSTAKVGDGQRFDGTSETGEIKLNSSTIGYYTPGSTISRDASKKVLPAGASKDESDYNKKTAYGDAIYIPSGTLNALWYYDKGSAQFITMKVVVDTQDGFVKVYQDDREIYAQDTFSEDMDKPYNIGKVELKTRLGGFACVNVASIKAFAGDGKEDSTVVPLPDEEKPVVKPTAKPSGGGGNSGGGNNGGGSPGGIGGGTAGPSPTATPEAVGPAQKYFTDLNDVDWAVESINSLYEKGVVAGVGDGRYEPLRPVTRAEYLTMLMRAFQADLSGAEASFTDVSPGEWYYGAVAKAAEMGVVTGYPDGSFGVDQTISRADMMVMSLRLAHALGLEIPQKREYTGFADEGLISEYAAEAVRTMYCAEIINGVGDGLLDPLGYADRAQAAKIVNGILEMEGTKHE